MIPPACAFSQVAEKSMRVLALRKLYTYKMGETLGDDDEEEDGESVGGEEEEDDMGSQFTGRTTEGMSYSIVSTLILRFMTFYFL